MGSTGLWVWYFSCRKDSSTNARKLLLDSSGIGSERLEDEPKEIMMLLLIWFVRFNMTLVDRFWYSTKFWLFLKTRLRIGLKFWLFFAYSLCRMQVFFKKKVKKSRFEIPYFDVWNSKVWDPFFRSENNTLEFCDTFWCHTLLSACMKVTPKCNRTSKKSWSLHVGHRVGRRSFLNNSPCGTTRLHALLQERPRRTIVSVLSGSRWWLEVRVW